MFTGRRGLRRTTRFGGGVFSPRSLPGLVAWYRADLGITIGTGVSAWADQSGTGDPNKNLTQATGTKQPTLNASDAAYNNKPTLSFAGVSAQFISSGTWVSSQSTPTIVVIGNDDGSATMQTFSDDQNGAATEVLMLNNSGTYAISAGTVLSSGVAASTASKVFIGVFNSVSSVVYLNAKTPKASGPAGSNVLTGISIGAAINGAVNLNGKIAEVAVYSRALNQSEINQVLAYCGARYAIAIGA